MSGPPVLLQSTISGLEPGKGGNANRNPCCCIGPVRGSCIERLLYPVSCFPPDSGLWFNVDLGVVFSCSPDWTLVTSCGPHGALRFSCDSLSYPDSCWPPDAGRWFNLDWGLGLAVGPDWVRGPCCDPHSGAREVRSKLLRIDHKELEFSQIGSCVCGILKIGLILPPEFPLSAFFFIQCSFRWSLNFAKLWVTYLHWWQQTGTVILKASALSGEMGGMQPRTSNRPHTAGNFINNSVLKVFQWLIRRI